MGKTQDQLETPGAFPKHKDLDKAVKALDEASTALSDAQEANATCRTTVRELMEKYELGIYRTPTQIEVTCNPRDAVVRLKRGP